MHTGWNCLKRFGGQRICSRIYVGRERTPLHDARVLDVRIFRLAAILPLRFMSQTYTTRVSVYPGVIHMWYVRGNHKGFILL